MQQARSPILIRQRPRFQDNPIFIRNAAFLGSFAANVGHSATLHTADFISNLSIHENLKQSLATRIADNIGNTEALRRIGVEYAHDVEHLLVKLGAGTRSWTPAERAEILADGRPRGSIGHHINSVSSNPALAANPDNVQIMRSREEHLVRGHEGDWRNPSEGELLNREEILEQNVRLKVMLNELAYVGIIFIIGFLVGALTSYVKRRNSEYMTHLTAGAKGATISLITYLSGRFCSYLFSNTPIVIGIQEHLVKRFGEEIAKEITGRLLFGFGISIALSALAYLRSRKAGHTRRYALRQAINLFVVSFVSIIVSTLVSGITRSALGGSGLGSAAGPVGTAVGLATGITVFILVFLVNKRRDSRRALKLLTAGNQGAYLLASRNLR